MAAEGKVTVSQDGTEVHPTAYQADSDPLTQAFQNLFTKFTDVIQGELQSSNSEYELLADMNSRIAGEYDNFGDFASGLRTFVERLRKKNEDLNRYLQIIGEIDQEVTELEALVSTLDNYTCKLQARIKETVSQRW